MDELPVSPGLSPRVRVNRQVAGGSGVALLSIPACAGEPDTVLNTGIARTVYPRVCGGTKRTRHTAGSSPGLSPRVRGNPKAGVIAMPAAGLSPRVRGNLRHRRSEMPNPGSIPACAGEPRRRWETRRTRMVYPRVCGGTLERPGAQGYAKGLSPRVRGNPGHRRCHSGRIRSIPACAGEPGVRLMVAGIFTVYPRVCGGTRRWPHSRRHQ